VSALFIIALIIWAISSLGLIILVLMHSGKGAGLSETFGGSMDPNLGTGVIEKNLNRITIICASVFIATLLLMMFVWPAADTGITTQDAISDLEEAGFDVSGLDEEGNLIEGDGLEQTDEGLGLEGQTGDPLEGAHTEDENPLDDPDLENMLP